MNMGDTQRKTTDAGRTGGKVPLPGTVAAPLRTDADAGGVAVRRAPPAPTRATPSLHGHAFSDARDRRFDGELPPDSRSRAARMTIIGLVLIALLGSGLALVGLAAR